MYIIYGQCWSGWFIGLKRIHVTTIRRTQLIVRGADGRSPIRVVVVYGGGVILKYPYPNRLDMRCSPRVEANANVFALANTFGPYFYGIYPEYYNIVFHRRIICIRKWSRD